MKALYTVKEASEMTGISKPALRVYSTRYAKWLSTEATPEKGQARSFTPADLKTLSFVYEQTTVGLNHEQVEEKLEAGELEAFQWSIQDAPPDAQESPQTALMAPEWVRVSQAFIEEYRQRDTAAQAREAELRDRIEALQGELGEARGRLAEAKSNRYRAPAWFRAIFGGRPD